MTCEKPPWLQPQPMNQYPVTTENVSGVVDLIPSASLQDSTSPSATIICSSVLQGRPAVITVIDEPKAVIVVVEG